MFVRLSCKQGLEVSPFYEVTRAETLNLLSKSSALLISTTHSSSRNVGIRVKRFRKVNSVFETEIAFFGLFSFASKR